MHTASWRAILEMAQNAFASLDAEGRVIDWNPRAEALFGYSREEAQGSLLADLIVPERHRERHNAGLARAAAGLDGQSQPRTLNIEGRRRDGTEISLDITVMAVQEEDGVNFHGWMQDVTERQAIVGELEHEWGARAPGFAGILDALAEAVTIRGRSGEILYANPAAVSSMGFTALKDMQARPTRSILEDYDVQDEQGRPVTMDDIPSVRLLAGEPAPHLTIRTVHRESGALTWQVLKASPLRDREGQLFAAVTIIEDITEEKLSELQDRFLAKATETLMSSLDYEETLRNVAHLAVPEVADWCAVDLVDEHGQRVQVAVAHQDPEKLELARRLRAYEPQEPDPDGGVGLVLRTGEAQLYSDITEEMLVAGAQGPEHLELLREISFRSVVLVPLRTPRGRILGVMTLVTSESHRRLGPEDLEFAQALAGRAAVAVDNARLASERRNIAVTLQRSLLPEVVPEIPDWEVAALYRAAGGLEEVEVGGDFYDFLETESGWIVLLGDVTGKGVEAASMTSLVRHGARFLGRNGITPSQILASLNDALCDQTAMSLCTAVCVKLEGTEVTLSNAGHERPLIVGTSSGVREVAVNGPILGAWRGGAHPEIKLPLSQQETLLLYTDGVVDTVGQEERFGGERLARALADLSGRRPQDLLEGLAAKLDEFQSETQADDTAAVALRPIS